MPITVVLCPSDNSLGLEFAIGGVELEDAEYFALSDYLCDRGSGLSVDPYDTTYFGGPSLSSLMIELRKALEAFNERPSVWISRVETWEQQGKEYTREYVVSRDMLCQKVGKTLELTRQALADEWRVAFIGD